MARKGWHRLVDGDAVTITRQVPARFDLSVAAFLPVPAPGAVSLTRLAHQVRQDMWRRLQKTRGFAPAVRVERVTGGVQVTAGGALMQPTEAARDTLRTLLDSPGHRERWLAHARRRAHV